MLGEHSRVIERHSDLDFVHLVKFEVLPHAVGNEKYQRVAVVDDMQRILRIKILKNGHNHGSVGEGGHVCHYPRDGVFAEQGYFVTLPYAALLEKKMCAGDSSRKIAVCECLSGDIIGNGRQLPVFFEVACIYLQ